jgi:hypothetical protein
MFFKSHFTPTPEESLKIPQRQRGRVTQKYLVNWPAHKQQGFVAIGLCIRRAETPAAYTANR